MFSSAFAASHWRSGLGGESRWGYQEQLGLPTPDHLKDLIHCIFEEAVIPRSNMFHYPCIIRHPKTHLSDITLGGSRSAPRQVEIPNSDLEQECDSPSKTWTVRAFAIPFSTRPTLLTLVPLKTSPCHPIMFKVVLSFPSKIGCDLWVLKIARPAPDIISRPLFTGRMFFIKKTGLSWITFMWEKLLCLPWAGANKFFLETHFAVNEVGSTSKEELNLLLWLLR